MSTEVQSSPIEVPFVVPRRAPRGVLWLVEPSSRQRHRLLVLTVGFLSIGVLIALLAVLVGNVYIGVFAPLGVLALGSAAGWVAEWWRKRRLTRTLRYGTAVPAEIVDVTSDRPGKYYKGRRVTFRYWPAPGVERTDHQYVWRAAHRPLVQHVRTVALRDPWRPDRALLPELLPVSLGESGDAMDLPPAPRTIAKRHLPGASIFVGMGIAGAALMLVPLLLGLGSASWATPALLGLGLSLILFGGLLYWGHGRELTQVATWGRRCSFRVEQLIWRNGRRAVARIRFVGDPAGTTHKVSMVVGGDWQPDSSEVHMGLVDPRIGLTGVGGDDRRVVVVPAPDLVAFATPPVLARPMVLPPFEALGLPEPMTLSLRARETPLPGLANSVQATMELADAALTLRQEGQPAQVLDGGRPFALEVSCWPEASDAEVCVTLRQGDVLVRVRGRRALQDLRADVPTQDVRAPWLSPEDFDAFWNWVALHAQAAGPVADQIALRATVAV